MLLDRKFNKDSKNALKIVIFVLKVAFTVDFASVLSNCVSGSLKMLTQLFSLTVLNFVLFFHIIR